MKSKLIKIYSENNYYQHVEVLKNNRTKRLHYREFFVEGVRNINEAIKNDWQVIAFAYSIERTFSDWARNILGNTRADFHYALTNNLMAKLSDKEDSSELIAIIKMPKDDINRIKPDGNFLVVVLDRPASRGNLGSIIRSCDALGAQGLLVTGHAVDLYDTETIRAATGSLFKLPVVRVPSLNVFTEWLRSLRVKHPDMIVAGASEKGNIDIDTADFNRAVILLMGNETQGLSNNLEQMSDILIKIPMSCSRAASSLNVACAASIFLYEIGRQRRAATHS